MWSHVVSADCSYLLTLVPRSKILLPWRWRRYDPPKRRFTQKLHGATSQKTAFFIVITVKTSNLTRNVICCHVRVTQTNIVSNRSYKVTFLRRVRKEKFSIANCYFPHALCYIYHVPKRLQNIKKKERKKKKSQNIFRKRNVQALDNGTTTGDFVL
jgi:hypothetical protein